MWGYTLKFLRGWLFQIRFVLPDLTPYRSVCPPGWKFPGDTSVLADIHVTMHAKDCKSQRFW